MNRLMREFARQLAAVYGHPPEVVESIVATFWATARDRGFEWVELDGPAFVAACEKLGIRRRTPRNLDAFLFNDD